MAKTQYCIKKKKHTPIQDATGRFWWCLHCGQILNNPNLYKKK